MGEGGSGVSGGVWESGQRPPSHSGWWLVPGRKATHSPQGSREACRREGQPPQANPGAESCPRPCVLPTLRHLHSLQAT